MSIRRQRVLGAVIAMAISGALPTAQWLVGIPIDLRDPDPFALIAPLSVPISGLLGAGHAPAIIRSREFGVVVVYFALQATLIGAAVISVIANLAALIRGATLHDPITGSVAVMLAGLLYAGLPVFAIALGVGAVWGYTLRWAIRLSQPRDYPTSTPS